MSERYVRKQIDGGFFWFSNSLIDDGWLAKMSGSAYKVLAVLNKMADSQATCYPSVRYIGDMAGLSRGKTVQKATKELQDLGLIRVEKRMRSAEEGGGQGANLYILLDPTKTDIDRGGSKGGSGRRGGTKRGGSKGGTNKTHSSTRPTLQQDLHPDNLPSDDDPGLFADQAPESKATDWCAERKAYTAEKAFTEGLQEGIESCVMGPWDENGRKGGKPNIPWIRRMTNDTWPDFSEVIRLTQERANRIEDHHEAVNSLGDIHGAGWQLGQIAGECIEAQGQLFPGAFKRRLLAYGETAKVSRMCMPSIMELPQC